MVGACSSERIDETPAKLALRLAGNATSASLPAAAKRNKELNDSWHARAARSHDPQCRLSGDLLQKSWKAMNP
jgi:hypothetical protein